MQSKPSKVKHPKIHNFQNLTGKKFTRLTALYYVGDASWYCKCSCGNCKIIPTKMLNRKQAKSCGCILREQTWNKTHGKKGTRIYRIWAGMLDRCRNSNSKDYPRYGARGVSVCKRWYRFENFYADMGDPPSGIHSIDRKDNEKGYCKSNCRWATPKEQANNRRKRQPTRNRRKVR